MTAHPEGPMSVNTCVIAAPAGCASVRSASKRERGRVVDLTLPYDVAPVTDRTYPNPCLLGPGGEPGSS